MWERLCLQKIVLNQHHSTIMNEKDSRLYKFEMWSKPALVGLGFPLRMASKKTGRKIGMLMAAGWLTACFQVSKIEYRLNMKYCGSKTDDEAVWNYDTDNQLRARYNEYIKAQKEYDAKQYEPGVITESTQSL